MKALNSLSRLATIDRNPLPDPAPKTFYELDGNSHKSKATTIILHPQDPVPLQELRNFSKGRSDLFYELYVTVDRPEIAHGLIDSGKILT
jgi:hypothetical protein